MDEELRRFREISGDLSPGSSKLKCEIGMCEISIKAAKSY